MKNARVLKQQLRALQASCASAIQNIESIVSLIDEDLKNDQLITDTKECRHPVNWLKDMRTMGHPRRFHCTQCNNTINVEDDALLEMASNNG
tara:strand:- start:639 stop:914 length:276 start_codon:yes stop_codon:yes gene_type:complete